MIAPARKYVAVANIRSGEIRYVGRNDAAAAAVLDPGTCFGKGYSQLNAEDEAKRMAEWFRSRQVDCPPLIRRMLAGGLV